MSLVPRIIPSLLLDGKKLVKTIRFRSPIYIGDPINAVKIFNDKEVDEIAIFDIYAWKKGIQFDYLKEIYEEAFMPALYGGGVKTINDLEKVFMLGVEKVSLSSEAIINKQLIIDAVRIFGSQSIVITIDIKKSIFGNYNTYTHNSKSKIKLLITEYINELEEIGVGEIILNFINKDGTKSGYDINFIKKISSMSSIPFIALGGAGKLEHISELLNKTEVRAAAAGSIFVFHNRNDSVLINYPDRSIIKKEILLNE